MQYGSKLPSTFENAAWKQDIDRVNRQCVCYVNEARPSVQALCKLNYYFFFFLQYRWHFSTMHE